MLAYYESLLALLQQLSQTKTGATYVLKSGLFDSVHESRLFAADPDIGIGQSRHQYVYSLGTVTDIIRY